MGMESPMSWRTPSAKAMKAMGAKEVVVKAVVMDMGAKEASVAAMGMMAMAVVFRGRRQMTAPGWTKAGLLISKRGRVGSRSPLQGPRGASAKFATPMEAMKAMKAKMMAVVMVQRAKG